MNSLDERYQRGTVDSHKLRPFERNDGMLFVIDMARKKVVASSRERSELKRYIRAVRELFGNHNPMFIANDWQTRDRILNGKYKPKNLIR